MTLQGSASHIKKNVNYENIDSVSCTYLQQPNNTRLEFRDKNSVSSI